MTIFTDDKTSQKHTLQNDISWWRSKIMKLRSVMDRISTNLLRKLLLLLKKELELVIPMFYKSFFKFIIDIDLIDVY